MVDYAEYFSTKVSLRLYHAAESSISLPRVVIAEEAGLQVSAVLVFLGSSELLANVE